jgi:hypothetical protein
LDGEQSGTGDDIGGGGDTVRNVGEEIKETGKGRNITFTKKQEGKIL